MVRRRQICPNIPTAPLRQMATDHIGTVGKGTAPSSSGMHHLAGTFHQQPRLFFGLSASSRRWRDSDATPSPRRRAGGQLPPTSHRRYWPRSSSYRPVLHRRCTGLDGRPDGAAAIFLVLQPGERQLHRVRRAFPPGRLSVESERDSSLDARRGHPPQSATLSRRFVAPLPSSPHSPPSSEGRGPQVLQVFRVDRVQLIQELSISFGLGASPAFVSGSRLFKQRPGGLAFSGRPSGSRRFGRGSHPNPVWG